MAASRASLIAPRRHCPTVREERAIQSESEQSFSASSPWYRGSRGSKLNQLRRLLPNGLHNPRMRVPQRHSRPARHESK